MVDGRPHAGYLPQAARSPRAALTAAPLGRSALKVLGGRFTMFCTNCRRQTATTDDGRCAECGLTPVVGAPAPAQLRPVLGLGRAAMVLLGVVALTDVAAIAATLHIRGLFASLTDGGFVAFTEAEGERADWYMYLTTSLQMMAELATAIVFIVWFHRVRTNAGVLAPDLLSRGPGWSIGAWFIPIANLWIPRGIAVEVWRASRPMPYADDTHEPHRPVNLWWTGFVVSWFALRAADRRYAGAEDPDAIVSAANLLVGAGVIDIVAAALTIHFVHRLTTMQRARAAERTAAFRPQPSAFATPIGHETPVPPMPQ